MKKVYLPIAIFTLLLLTGCGKSEEQPASNKGAFYIYLIAREGTSHTGRTIECNDVLVPTTKEIRYEKSSIEAVINELLITKDSDELKNYVVGPQLMLMQVTMAGGEADIYLKGDLKIQGACDIPRIREQLYETASQFPEIKKVRFYINDQTLERYLDIAGKGL